MTKCWIFQTTSAKTSHLAAMEKATENLSALESNLLKLTKPGGCTIKTLLTFFYAFFYGLFVKIAGLRSTFILYIFHDKLTKIIISVVLFIPGSDVYNDFYSSFSSFPPKHVFLLRKEWSFLFCSANTRILSTCVNWVLCYLSLLCFPVAKATAHL